METWCGLFKNGFLVILSLISKQLTVIYQTKQFSISIGNFQLYFRQRWP